MNNLNKFTKAELITKFKNLENKKSNQSILENILYYKNIFLKIILIAFLIKWIKNIL